MERTSPWILFGAAILVPLGILAIGFRISYDSVIPEVFGLAVTGAVFGYVRPRHVWLSIIGIAIGIFLSERVFPATPTAEHIARYGRPVRGGLGDFIKLCAIPTIPALLGALVRIIIDPTVRPFRTGAGLTASKR
jgi:hypothetical protein